jgi:hypothetical protein
VSPLSAVEYDEYEVVDTCRRAASRLRSQPRRVASESAQLESLVGDLLDAVATALAMRRASVPEGVQRAALRVAQSVRARHEGGAWGGHYDHGLGRGGASGVRHGVSREAVGGQDAPFTPSIRLGRMG